MAVVVVPQIVPHSVQHHADITAIPHVVGMESIRNTGCYKKPQNEYKQS